MFHAYHFALEKRGSVLLCQPPSVLTAPVLYSASSRPLPLATKSGQHCGLGVSASVVKRQLA